MLRSVLPILVGGLVMMGCAAPLGRAAPGEHRVDTAAPVPLEARLRPSDGWARCDAWREARTPADPSLACFCRARANKKSWVLAGVGTLGTAVYGVTVWDYGSSDFHVTDEGWLGEDTDYGGADKAGHFITSYFGTALVAAVHRQWGFTRREAALRGALTSMLWMTGIEVGDALSENYGFSFQDLAADALGCLAGYLHETSPWFNRVVDFRWEYWPTPGSLEDVPDPAGDYSGASYLVALNVGALTSRRPSGWDLLDVQFGYQTRGYVEHDPDPERWIYVGVGLNLANLLRRAGFRYAAFFDYYQVPFISLRLGYELNEGETGLLYAP